MAMLRRMAKTGCSIMNMNMNGRRSMCIVIADVDVDGVTSHTDKWMQNKSKKSPMQLINEVPPIKVDARIVACEGDHDPALGHPIEFICLDLHAPAVCKYCGLRYVQNHH